MIRTEVDIVYETSMKEAYDKVHKVSETRFKKKLKKKKRIVK